MKQCSTMILIISMPSDGVIALENDLSLPTHKYTIYVILWDSCVCLHCFHQIFIFSYFVCVVSVIEVLNSASIACFVLQFYFLLLNVIGAMEIN